MLIPDEQKIPRPSLSLVVVSIAQIGIALWFVSLAFASLASLWNVCEWVSAIILAIPMAAYACYQYFGTFRRREKCAYVAGLLSAIALAMWGLVCIPMFSLAVEGGKFPVFAAVMLAVAILSGVGATLNFLWSSQLRLAVERGAAPPAAFQFSLRELIVLATVLCAMLATTMAMIGQTRPQFADHVSSQEAPFRLPQGASDVSYYRYGRAGFEVEFTVDEQDLVDWFESGVGVFRSRGDGEKLTEIRSSKYINRPSEFSGPDRIVVRRGLSHGWFEKGNGTSLIYDQDAKRAYYHVGFD